MNTKWRPFLQKVVQGGGIAIVGAGLSLFLMGSGLLSPFYLLPFGVVAYRFSPKVSWISWGVASLLHLALGIKGGFPLSIGSTAFYWELLYFGILSVSFVVMVLPGMSVRTLYRFLGGALISSVVFLGLLQVSSGKGEQSLIQQVVQEVLRLYEETATIDGEASLGESLVEKKEEIATFIWYLLLYGGALVGHLILVSVNYFLARFFDRSSSPKGAVFIGRFTVPPGFIWLLSLSLLLLVLGAFFNVSILQIVGGNGIVVGGFVYLVQGMGILVYLSSHPAFPGFLRTLGTVLFLVALFIPGINVIPLGICIILGIAETWVPLRVPYTTGSSSTPGM